MKAVLKLPETQSRETFSIVALSDRAKIPLIKLPDAAANHTTPRLHPSTDDVSSSLETNAEDDESDDTDVEDVEELFLELAHEVNHPISCRSL